VKFHPRNSDVLASGSLDSHVRVWDVPSGNCMHSYNFGECCSESNIKNHCIGGGAFFLLSQS